MIIAAGSLALVFGWLVGLTRRRRQVTRARAAGMGAIAAAFSTLALMPVVELGDLALELLGVTSDGAPIDLGETLLRSMFEAGFALVISGPVTIPVGAPVAVGAWALAARRTRRVSPPPRS